MLSKKDYEIIAKILHENQASYSMITRFVIWLEKDNTKFDRAKFLKVALW